MRKDSCLIVCVFSSLVPSTSCIGTDDYSGSVPPASSEDNRLIVCAVTAAGRRMPARKARGANTSPSSPARKPREQQPSPNSPARNPRGPHTSPGSPASSSQHHLTSPRHRTAAKSTAGPSADGKATKAALASARKHKVADPEDADDQDQVNTCMYSYRTLTRCACSNIFLLLPCVEHRVTLLLPCVEHRDPTARTSASSLCRSRLWVRCLKQPIVDPWATCIGYCNVVCTFLGKHLH